MSDNAVEGDVPPTQHICRSFFEHCCHRHASSLRSLQTEEALNFPTSVCIRWSFWIMLQARNINTTDDRESQTSILLETEAEHNNFDSS